MVTYFDLMLLIMAISYQKPISQQVQSRGYMLVLSNTCGLLLPIQYRWCPDTLLKPGWQRGSVVRTAVFHWRTFPDLCLIYGWHVTTLWVKCPLWVNQRGQLSLPSLRVGKWVVIHVITWITKVKTIKRQTGAARVVVWLQGCKPVCAGLAYRLHVRSVYDVQRFFSCSCSCGAI